MNSDNNQFSIIGECEVHDTVEICKGAIIGKPYRKFLDGTRGDLERTYISSGVYIGSHSIVGNGSRIDKNSIIDDYCLLECRVRVGSSSLVTNRAQICNEVIVGSNCVIGGFIGERTVIGDSCRVFGQIVHCHNNPHLGWDDDEAMEDAPSIGNSVFIGFNSLIIGRVSIGHNTYICAGSTVTKDVPDFHIVTGNNMFIHYKNWKGSLSNSNFFRESK